MDHCASGLAMAAVTHQALRVETAVRQGPRFPPLAAGLHTMSEQVQELAAGLVAANAEQGS
jgi:X-X-X-Leu-X-X-Gly heptad repeat protein